MLYMSLYLTGSISDLLSLSSPLSFPRPFLKTTMMAAALKKTFTLFRARVNQAVTRRLSESECKFSLE